MSQQMTFWDIPSVISSPESGSGAMPCAAPGGLMNAPSGREVAPASLSARQAKERGLMTSGTFGPRSSISSASAALSRSLANRLQAVTVLCGSILYRLTWRVRATPSGRSIPALRASALRTSGKDCTGWRSPSASDPVGGVMEIRSGCAGRYKLRDEAHLAGWPTPKARDFHTEGKGKYSPSLSRVAGTLAG